MYLHLTEHNYSLTKIQQAVIITDVIKDNNALYLNIMRLYLYYIEDTQMTLSMKIHIFNFRMDFKATENSVSKRINKIK